MGEGVRDYRGELLVSHTGGLQGMVTQVSMLPGRSLGVIVLTNQEEGAAFLAITNTILDHYLGAKPKDWVAAFQSVRAEQKAQAKEAVAKAAGARNAASKPSLPLASYAGRYRDPWYGDVLVEPAGAGLAMRFTHTPILVGTLEHWQYDTFVVRWKDRTLDADAYVTFTLDPDGKVARLAMKAVSPSTDFSFDFHDLALAPVAPGAQERR